MLCNRIFVFFQSDKFYQEVKDLAADLVKCVNKEVLALAAAGCQYIQVCVFA